MPFKKSIRAAHSRESCVGIGKIYNHLTGRCNQTKSQYRRNYRAKNAGNRAKEITEKQALRQELALHNHQTRQENKAWRQELALHNHQTRQEKKAWRQELALHNHQTRQARNQDNKAWRQEKALDQYNARKEACIAQHGAHFNAKTGRCKGLKKAKTVKSIFAL